MTTLRTPLRERARGRWRSIISMLGLADMKTLSGRHVPCPFCGGKDRFRFDDKGGAGTFICAQCPAGDGVTFVMRKMGLDFKGAAERIESVIGAAPIAAPVAQRSERQMREAMDALWASSNPVRPDDPVARFHGARGIRLKIYPECLRCSPRARHHDGERSGWYPAQVAMVHGPDGSPATLHRTYLTDDGYKAAIDDPRKLMPGTLPKGSAVRLAEQGAIIGIAEGIETALAAAILFDVPVWAALNAANLAGWLPPQGVRQVLIFGDNDDNFVGQKAAYGLATQLRKASLDVEVRIPQTVGDWNDQLQISGLCNGTNNIRHNHGGEP